MKSPKQGHASQYRYSYKGGQHADTPAPASRWVLMTNDIIPDSRFKSYADQRALVNSYAQKSGIPYQVPNILDAAVYIFMEYVQSGSRLYGDNPTTYTRCQEKEEHVKYNDISWQLVIGVFSPDGLNIGTDCHYGSYGVGCSWKL